MKIDGYDMGALIDRASAIYEILLRCAIENWGMNPDEEGLKRQIEIDTDEFIIHFEETLTPWHIELQKTKFQSFGWKRGRPLKQWFSAIELIGLPGLPSNEQAIKRKARKERWTFRKQGHIREYSIASLPDISCKELLCLQNNVLLSIKAELEMEYGKR